jgi:hypothetical protein
VAVSPEIVLCFIIILAFASILIVFIYFYVYIIFKNKYSINSEYSTIIIN